MLGIDMLIANILVLIRDIHIVNRNAIGKGYVAV